MKIHFTSLGCSRNLADAEKMMQLLSSQGHEIIPDLSRADLLVVNTCGFLKSARKEGTETIEALLKEKKKEAFLIVTGCMIPLHLEELERVFSKKIDATLSPHEEEKIVAIVEQLDKKRKKASLLSSKIEKRLFTTTHFAYLKIADGCQKQCSYCIIPKIRGGLKSLEEKEILNEFHSLLEMGVFEVVLVAQDLGSYGKDRQEKHGLAKLLKKMLQDKRNFWIRLLYLYPDAIDEELLDVMSSDARVCPYFDIPLQHVNTRLLRLMNRPFSKQKTVELLARIQEKVPNATLRTSLMVGFPSETEEEFQELCAFVQKGSFDHVGIFRFSKEKEAKAALLAGDISEKVKKERERKLATCQLEVVRKKQEKRVGQQIDVLIEGFHPDSPYLAVGRSQAEAPDVDGTIIINDIEPIKSFGKVYRVEITSALDYDLIGRIVEKKGKKR